jgi:hypothetical protein
LNLMKSHLSPAEDLPALYRVILDGVAVLERRGARAEAARIRAAATRAYSTAWNEEQVRRLAQLAERCRQAVEDIDRPVDGGPGVSERGRRLRGLSIPLG